MKNLIFILFFFYSCKSITPILIYIDECDDKSIEQYIESCMPQKAQTQREKDYYKKECLRKAKEIFCIEVKYLNIKNKDVKCDNVPKKYRKYCH